MLNVKLKIIKHKTITQTVSVSDIFLFKSTCVNIGLDTLKFTTYVTSDIDTHTSHFRTLMRFVTSLSRDFEPEISIPSP